ncbi:MAG: hypothetical protein FWG35_05785 [Spirochaetaceae bacterium]|nr:hypothetical protein [Spirochaetaceae bacterium]
MADTFEGKDLVFTPTDTDRGAARQPEHPEFGPVLLVLNSKKIASILGTIVIIGFIVLLFHSSATGQLVTTTGEPSPIDNPFILVGISVVLLCISAFRLYNCTRRVLFYKRHMIVQSLREKNSYAYKDIADIKYIENRQKASILNARLFSNKIVWVYQVIFGNGTTVTLDSVHYSFLPIKLAHWKANLTAPGEENTRAEEA